MPMCVGEILVLPMCVAKKSLCLCRETRSPYGQILHRHVPGQSPGKGFQLDSLQKKTGGWWRKNLWGNFSERLWKISGQMSSRQIIWTKRYHFWNLGAYGWEFQGMGIFWLEMWGTVKRWGMVSLKHDLIVVLIWIGRLDSFQIFQDPSELY